MIPFMIANFLSLGYLIGGVIVGDLAPSSAMIVGNYVLLFFLYINGVFTR